MEPDDQSQNVHLELTLIGGHQIRTRIHQDAPIIPRLLQAYAAGPTEPQPVAFGLPTLDERGTIFVRACDIMSLQVDRVVQPTALPIAERRMGCYLKLRDFLQPQTKSALLDYVLARQHELKSSTITDTVTGGNVVKHMQRVSSVLYDLTPFQHLFAELIYAILPTVLLALDVRPFPVGRIESQITAHEDGAFFKRHSDNSGGPNVGRRVTYVYYFHAEPKAFSGGNLNLHEGHQPAVSIEPLDNSMIFFPSYIEHDVSAVHCPDPQLRNARFTVNGWIHEA